MSARPVFFIYFLFQGEGKSKPPAKQEYKLNHNVNYFHLKANTSKSFPDTDHTLLSNEFYDTYLPEGTKGSTNNAFLTAVGCI